MAQWPPVYCLGKCYAAPSTTETDIEPRVEIHSTVPIVLLGVDDETMRSVLSQVAVKAGQEVKAGEPLAVVEAMKMENVLRAERDGKVKVLHAQPGASLAVDQKIVEFE